MHTDAQTQHGNGTFVPGSVRVVDYDTSNNNILIRGSSSFGAANFPSISLLVTAITQDPNFSSTNIDLSSNPLVIDFCLIGFGPGSKDQGIVDAELTWFTPSPPVLNGSSGPYPVCITSSISANPGTMVYWPIQAIGGTAPTTAGEPWPVSPANSIGDNPTTQFNFAGLVPAIRNALINNTAALPAPLSLSTIKNAIIYVHCDSGVNKTGAAVVGYLMAYGSNLTALSLPALPGSPYPLAQAQTAANLAPPSNDTDPPGGSDIPVAEAYCNYLATGQLDAKLAAACVPLAPSL